MGNAAHTFYPIAVQGFNLNLADMTHLVDVIESEKSLSDYVSLRQRPQHVTALFTQSLADIFSSDFLPTKIGRRSALTLLTKVPLLKNKLAQFAMGSI